MRSEKTHTSLRIREVWSGFSLLAWREHGHCRVYHRGEEQKRSDLIVAQANQGHHSLFAI